ncbi:hypothetical protein [Nocardiopsis baichengensis]|uniref:hypothetical protein n=1 Tax=Nocardiopsis baichengensis TaxID=280240 RepID=UPI00034C693F|nr:hypothetical protein [Nocardiopsis baichengensis]
MARYQDPESGCGADIAITPAPAPGHVYVIVTEDGVAEPSGVLMPTADLLRLIDQAHSATA